MSHENVELVRSGFGHFVATGEPAWETLWVVRGRQVVRLDYYDGKQQAMEAVGLEE